MRAFLLSALLLTLGGATLAAKPRTQEAPGLSVPPPTLPSFEERQAAFGQIDELLKTGQSARAADALVALVEDPSKSVFYAEAYARLGAVLEDLDLPYGALVAYQRALGADAVAVSSVAKNAIALGDKVGDTALLEPVFASNVGLDVDADTRSRMAYLAAREAHHQGNYGTAIALLKMVQATDPYYAEAKSLEGVVLSIQGRHKDAIAPLLIAQATSEEAKKPARLRNAIRLNLARAYFAAENFPRAIEVYATVDRESGYWPESVFERAWGHFRLTDMNGTLSQLQTLHSPYFEDWYFPEADMLRVYSLFLLCKFPDASKGITQFQENYKPQLQALREVSARDAATVFAAERKWVEKRQGKELPRALTRLYEDEQRFLDSLESVHRAEDEMKRLQNVSANPFSTRVSAWVSERRDAIIAAEGERIREEAAAMADRLDSMLTDSEMSRLDMMQFETRLYEQAANTGKIEEAREQVSRRQRVKRGYVSWPWQGEYWADELGYYRIETRSDCPASLQAAGGGG